MKIITAPQETALYPGLVAIAIMDVRMKLGMSRIQLNYRKIFNQIGVLRRNRRNFRYPSFSPATSASRSMISLLP
ncbi:hypothetical protein AO411_2019865 [Salmonella enterica subsp. enterica serovar Sarajane]|nr:hypothetical protein AO411_2019865 [Salmonella enterica subsp. enterica serovar Sarajane]